MPLVSDVLIVNPGQSGDVRAQPLHAIGSSLHGQVSAISTFSANGVWDSADLSAEIAFNHRMSVSRNRAALNEDRNKFAAALRVVFEPPIFEVRPGLTLSLPLGVGYGIAGDSSVDGSQNERTGDVEIGVRATYRTVWRGEISFTHFIGSSDHQFFADRDFVSLSIRRTF